MEGGGGGGGSGGSVLSYYKVIFNFEAEDASELSCKAGEILQCDASKAENEIEVEGWIFLTSLLADKPSGFVPKDYVESTVLDVEETRKSESTHLVWEDTLRQEQQKTRPYTMNTPALSAIAESTPLHRGTTSMFFSTAGKFGNDHNNVNASTNKTMSASMMMSSMGRLAPGISKPSFASSADREDLEELSTRTDVYLSRLLQNQTEASTNLSSFVDTMIAKMLEDSQSANNFVQAIAALDLEMEADKVELRKLLEREKQQLLSDRSISLTSR